MNIKTDVTKYESQKLWDSQWLQEKYPERFQTKFKQYREIIIKK